MADLDALPRVPDPCVERWLERLAALTPDEWGRLDAASAAFSGRGIGARLRVNAHLAAAFRIDDPEVPPALVTALRYAFVGLGLTFDVLVGVGEDRRERLQALRARLPRTEPAPRSPGEEASRAYMQATEERMIAILEAAPGAAATRTDGARGALRFVLNMALVALLLREGFAAEALRELHAPVEPVIPFASLGEAPVGLLPSGS